MSNNAFLRRGLTLVELIVVLLILVAVSSVALRSTEQVVKKGRFDATTRQLKEIELAVVGDPTQRGPDGTRQSSGFVADIGRLPQLQFGAPQSQSQARLQLRELWEIGTLQPYSIQPAPIDSRVILATGWRGPYLRLPLGNSDGLADAWNNPFEFSVENPHDFLHNPPPVPPYSVGNPILALRSQGSGTGDAFAVTQQISFQDSATSTDLITSTVQGTVVWGSDRKTPDPEGDPDDVVLVVLYGPDGTAGAIAWSQEQFEPEPSPVLHYEVIQFEFSSTIGPKVIRAYQGKKADLLPLAVGTLDKARLASEPIRLELVRGGQIQDLVLRSPWP